MKILLTPDKFKGSLSAKGVINAMEKGIYRVFPDAQVSSIIASDGGDGFLQSVSEYISCHKIQTSTFDPLGREINTYYLYQPKNNTAYVELAKASGIELLDEKEKNPLLTSTYGTGLQIKHAMAQGAKTIYVGLGGSATNDGGIGMAAALGYLFIDSYGAKLKPKGESLSQIATIDKEKLVVDIDGVSIIAVNDVDNPLYGKNGAAFIYGKQKGASPSEIEDLDAGLKNLDKQVEAHLGKSIANEPGSGAAGGAAYGLKAFFNATYTSGIDFVLKLAGVDSLLRQQGFDYIITGEGKFDEQTLNGKLIKGVVELGAKHLIPVVVVCGKLDMKMKNYQKLGLHQIIEVMDHSKSFEYNMENASILIENSVHEAFKSQSK